MRRLMILAAIGVVLAANVWVLISVSGNRSDAPGGTLELTERELRLPTLVGESTALFLDLQWDTISFLPDRTREPLWLDAAKLSELGFDCSLPVMDPDASEYYGSLMPTEVFLVLEYEGEAWKSAPPDRKGKTRLFAIDAGRDPKLLREKYADIARFIIARALVRPRFQDRDDPEGELLPQPRVQGRIDTVLPSQIFVPLPYSRSLQGLRHRDESIDEEEVEGFPRFRVTVSWGRHYEPWVRDVDLTAED